MRAKPVLTGQSLVHLGTTYYEYICCQTEESDIGDYHCGANVAPMALAGSFSLTGITAASAIDATSDVVKADLASAIKASLGAGSVVIDSLVADSERRALAATGGTGAGSTGGGNAAARILASFSLTITFTATFITAAASDTASQLVTASPASTASAITTYLSTYAASAQLSGGALAVEGLKGSLAGATTTAAPTTGAVKAR
jgi:hypothetical protein